MNAVPKRLKLGIEEGIIEIIDSEGLLERCPCGGEAVLYEHKTKPHISFSSLSILCDECNNSIHNGLFDRTGKPSEMFPEFEVVKADLINRWNAECKAGIEYYRMKRDKERAEMKEFNEKNMPPEFKYLIDEIDKQHMKDI